MVMVMRHGRWLWPPGRGPCCVANVLVYRGVVDAKYASFNGSAGGEGRFFVLQLGLVEPDICFKKESLLKLLVAGIC